MEGDTAFTEAKGEEFKNDGVSQTDGVCGDELNCSQQAETLNKDKKEGETETDNDHTNTSSNNNTNKQTQGDGEEIFPCFPAPPLEVKLFVGRIPRSHNEDELKPIFEQYGKVAGVSVIRDKNNSTHKGSAFVRMACIAQADAAVRALNNQKVLDENLGPLQVKYATGEAEKLGINDAAGEAGLDQAKLFIGSIPKSMTEEEIKEFFCPYGQVDEIYIMKDSATGTGKGCAFVKYAYKEQAVYAVKSLDRKHTFEGCSRPVEVRFAESRTQKQLQGGASANTMPGAMPVLFQHTNMVGMPPVNIRASAMPTAYPSIINTMPIQQMATNTVAAAAAAAPVVQRQESVWKEYISAEGRPYYHNELTNTTQWEKPAEFDAQQKMNTAVAAAPAAAVTNMNAGAIATNVAAAAYMPVVANTAFLRPIGSAYGGCVSQEIAAGPPGANIFIFHVPPEWTNSEILAAFSPFGNVISARVATDKSANNKTKGYAFVSYDNVESAALAITHMNGFLWGGKKLKVTIKKGEEYIAQQMLMAGATKAISSTAAATTTNTGELTTVGTTNAAVSTNITGGYAACNGQSTNAVLQVATATSPYNVQYSNAYNLGRYTPY